MRVTPLGAGQHVGRSCVLLEIAGRQVLLDCGVAVAVPEERRYPELAAVDVSKLDLVILSHFHLDHAGALPYLTEVLGYNGPLLMTHPTRAIAPIILREYLQLRYRKREEARYDLEMIDACFERARCIQLEERVEVGEISVTAYYAGHVLGAVMVLVEAGGLSALYTGDFTTVPDHHLSAARLPLGLRPDVMITETTCCTTVRSSKRLKEYELCCKVQDCLEKGGKVLVPVLMMGRSQEMCMIFEEHWARAQLAYPIFVIKGTAQKAQVFFRLFAAWGSQQVRGSTKPFDFPHVRFVDTEEVLAGTTPAVVLAGPAMLDGGSSLELFKALAPDSKNLVVIPGYCLPGTVGNLVQAKTRKIQLDDKEIHVRCEVETVVHSDHADSRGISELISQAAPKQVVLVHGGESLMKTFLPIVKKRLRVPCHSPAVGEAVELPTEESIKVLASSALAMSAEVVPPPPVLDSVLASGPVAATFTGLLKRQRDTFELHARSAEGLERCGMKMQRVRFRHRCVLPAEKFRKAVSGLAKLGGALGSRRGISDEWSGSGEAFELDLGSLCCQVQPQGGNVGLTVLWDSAAEQEAELVELLKMLGVET
ncbi:unnamed protein product [Effrenium voratum]|uniref:Integrator complex subunit 11 n=1 Tax=Effrenium voratum TaxID=2562239 RepID=A0AA36J1L1_9DINO|nr:unnamed protein product [Effrenium voratum]